MRQGGSTWPLTENISDKDAMEIGLLEQFGQFDPVVHVGEFPGLVVWVSP